MKASTTIRRPDGRACAARKAYLARLDDGLTPHQARVEAKRTRELARLVAKGFLSLASAMEIAGGRP